METYRSLLNLFLKNAKIGDTLAIYHVPDASTSNTLYHITCRIQMPALKPANIFPSISQLSYFLLEQHNREDENLPTHPIWLTPSLYFTFFFYGSTAPSRSRLPHFSRLHDHTQTHHTRYDSSGRGTSQSQRPLLDNTQHSLGDRHPCLLRDSNPQSQQASGRRPRGHWDRLTLLHHGISTSQTDRKSITVCVVVQTPTKGHRLTALPTTHSSISTSFIIALGWQQTVV
jgi:hypothetical protein